MILLAAVVQIAREAGREILAHYEKAQIEVRSKADFSPVTAADLAADEIIRAGLEKALPGSAYVSEEAIDNILSVDQAVSLLQTAGACWLVDPLDGTREFLSGTDDFTVNIALIEEGKLRLGVMFAPARGLMYCAEKGKGSFKVGDDRSLERLSGRPPNIRRMRALVSRQHTQGEEQLLRSRIDGIVVEQCGSALKYGYLAEGIADFSLRRSPTSVWDTAAAQCILEEAGGAIWAMNGHGLSPSHGTLKNPPFLAVANVGMPESLKRDLLASLTTANR
jgi:3'(2'), 5'-bisphosphate nucleotidase